MMGDLDRNFLSGDGSECELTLTETHLILRAGTADSVSSEDADADCVPLNWIIAVENAAAAIDIPKKHNLTIHYIVYAPTKEDDYKLGTSQFTIYGKHEVQCEQWKQHIDSRINTCNSRPRNMLVFINPASGKGKAEEMFNKHASPVFTLAGVTMDIIVTTKSNHSTDILDKYDLNKINSIVAVGGDGTFCVVADGLLRRLKKDAGLDVNDPNSKLPKSDIALGVIASGSADALSKGFAFSRDPLTCALTILMGCTRCKDVYVTSSASQLVGYASIGVCYGFTAKVMSTMDNLTWMGPARYATAPLILFFGRPQFHVELHIKTDDLEEWQHFTGEVHDLGALLMDMRYVMSQNSLIRVFEGERCKLPDMMAMKTCGILEHLRLMLDISKPLEYKRPPYHFVKEYKRITSFRMKAFGSFADTSGGLLVFIDGEVKSLPAPELEVRVCTDVLRVFTRSDLEEMYRKETEKRNKHI